ncbi:histidine-type phosphatase [uncultured Alistipes sp.]|uniref:histidine-type phosphatase n=1 Tax=uncultured Alistipes sp. TaxID=538949 RepID=UPI0025E83FB0|nr:histidine-type phosphatase [uncultured Alistipes sp.]
MKRLTLRFRLLAALLLLGLSGVTAQTAREQIAQMPERAGGIYHSYEYRPGPAVSVPEGYEPFYISHYGRHGSRWHATENVYQSPLAILRQAAEADALTPLGRNLLERVEIIAADAAGRYGDLSPRGVAEHRGIAERMFNAYPGVFSTAGGRECRIESRSTLVPRCILSMAAFNERLKELNPEISMTRESSARYMPYMGNNKGLEAQRKETLKTADSVRVTRMRTERLMNSLFSDPQFIKHEVKRPAKLMEHLLLQAAVMQDVDYLGISLYDIFTKDEIYAAWEDENFRRYVMFGPSKRFGDPIIADAKPLLRNMIETAQQVIDGEEDLSASLRFGHDVNVIPLLALLGVEGASARVSTPEELTEVWQVHRVSPMATNVQMIFYRNDSGDVLVRVLHCERDAVLPIVGGPFYRWETLRDYCKTLYK